MPISDAAINALPSGKDVYDDLTYCMQEWQNAGFEAVQGLADPSDDSSSADWVITLIGNLAWAATVFFPPAFAAASVAKVSSIVLIQTETLLVNPYATRVLIASASTATKAVSMLGATLAADVVGRLRRLAGNMRSPVGKAFLTDYLGNQVPDLLKEYVAGADPWVRKDLINHLIAQYSLRAHPRPDDNNDAGFTTFYNSVAGGEERRRFVWDDFVFPDFRTPYDNKPDGQGGKWPGGRGGLKSAIGRSLEGALKDFDQQWKQYRRELNNYVRAVAAGARGMGELARAEYLQRHPFDPVLKYSGVPDKLQSQQQSNQRKLSSLVKASA